MKLRLSPELKALIEESAKASNRTLNAEITARLEQSFKQDTYKGINQNEIKQMLREVINDVVEYQARHFESWLDKKIAGEIPPCVDSENNIVMLDDN